MKKQWHRFTWVKGDPRNRNCSQLHPHAQTATVVHIFPSLTTGQRCTSLLCESCARERIVKLIDGKEKFEAPPGLLARLENVRGAK